MQTSLTTSGLVIPNLKSKFTQHVNFVSYIDVLMIPGMQYERHHDCVSPHSASN